MLRTIAAVLVIAASALMFAGCEGADVVLKYGQSSFEEIVEAFPELIGESEEEGNYYTLSVDGETLLKISRDYGETDGRDISLVTPLKPFTDAGLEASQLGAGYRAEEGLLYLDTDFGSETGELGDVTRALFESVRYDRMALSYHEELDHYGIMLFGGKFEFAKDYKDNDKDIVFVLEAEPLAEMGADVENIDGWAFATMEDGMEVLLKPYDLN